MRERFRRFACWVSEAMGSAWAFMLALAVVAVWAITGPMFRFSEAWQLVINTGTTIVTFLMVFIIQNSQNREVRALQLKLDELIVATRHARNGLLDVEDLSDDDLKRLQKEFVRVGKKASLKDDVQGELEERERISQPQ